MADTGTKDRWDKLEIGAKIISAVAVPVLIGYFGYNVNKSLKEEELRVKQLDIGIGILMSPADESPRVLREWGIKLVNANTPGIPLPTDLEAYLLEERLKSEAISETRRLAERAYADAAAGASAAEAARAAADRAAQAASSAQSTADQALAAATEAQACCEANRESMLRMFRNSMSQ